MKPTRIPLIIRRAKSADASAICRTHRASINGLCAKHYSSRQLRAWLRGITWLNTRKGMARRQTFVASLKGRIVGFSAIQEGEVYAVYVLPRHTRNGVGGELLRAVESVARRHRLRALGLASSVNAVPFYREQGYKVVRWGSHTFRRSSVSIRCAHMRKRLGKRGS